ncbi:MAG: MFS transporter [Candidatus Nanopelagicales bacterium]
MSSLSWITAVAVLNGAIWRLPAGILADRYGGRIVFTLMLLLTAIPAYLVAHATSYVVLLFYAFLVGFAGNSFSRRASRGSAPGGHAHLQGTALGVFGAGNVGASVTKFIGPALIAAVPAAGLLGGVIPGGWRFVPFLVRRPPDRRWPQPPGSSPPATTTSPARVAPSVRCCARSRRSASGASACTT